MNRLIRKVLAYHKMTLDEAIEHAQEEANELKCTDWGKDHQQLTDWLKELKQLRSEKIKK